MLIAAAVGDLDEAEPVAAGIEPHGLGIDGDGARGEDALGQILFVEMDGHEGEIGRSAARLNLAVIARSVATKQSSGLQRLYWIASLRSQ
jgi:hypothetical protein